MCFPFLDPPGPPIELTADEVTKSTCTLSWKPPTDDGGAPIEGYQVERRYGSSTKWIKISKKKLIEELTFAMKDLAEGETYEFRVSAKNKAGFGKPCEPIGITAQDPWDKPGPPSKPTVTDITATEATIEWSPPESDGGSPITNYFIEYRVTGTTKWLAGNLAEKCPTTTFTVKGLTEAEYEFRVTAENRAGQGQPSPPSDPRKYGE